MKSVPTRSPKRRGFTLMEMLVVLGILVLLAALVLPRMLGSKKEADITSTKIQIKALRECLKQYALHMRDFPTTEQGLVALIECPSDVNETVAARWQGPYIEDGEVPADPWGNPYMYEYPPTHGKGGSPDIWSMGPDGEDDTDDDVVSWNKDDSSDMGAGGAASSTTTTTPSSRSNPSSSTSGRSR